MSDSCCLQLAAAAAWCCNWCCFNAR